MGQCFGVNQAAQSSNAAGIPAGAAGNIPPTIALHRIKKATKDFKHTKLIGEGGSAHVFKGRLENGQIVAVKRLKLDVNRYMDYENEVQMLSRCSHPNIINLIGCCADDVEEERIILYEFMPLGTLHHQLYGRKSGQDALDWYTRMRIAADVAKGLSYLHNEADPPIIYRDLKPSNVLIGDGFHTCISDFGIAVSAPPNENTVVRTGTPPFWAPENADPERLSFKSDVYSFGVMLLEIILGNVPLDPSGAVADWVKKIDDQLVRLADKEMNGLFPKAMLKKATNLALICMNVNPASRPEMIDVVRGMNHLARDPDVDEWPAEFNVVEVESSSRCARWRKWSFDYDERPAEFDIAESSCRCTRRKRSF